MQKEIIILKKFLEQVIERSKKYGMGRDYICGQFIEACHQLQLKNYKDQKL